MRILLISAIAVFSGCASVEPVVEPTKSWENHYMTVKQFQDGTRGMKLEKGESVWVLSNRTLSRTLKEFKDKYNDK